MATKKINTDLQLTAKLLDTSGDAGTSNQVLVSTATGINWVDGSGSGIIGGPYLPLAGGTLSGDLTVSGDLIISGSETILNTETVQVEDNIIQLNRTPGSPDTATAATSGITIYRGNGVTEASLIFDDADDTWDLTNNLAVAGNLTIGESGTTPLLDMMFNDHANGPGWDTRIQMGLSNDFAAGTGAFPTYVPSGAYGVQFQAYSDGVFFGMEEYTAGHYRPIIQWGDDNSDSPFRIKHENGSELEISYDGNVTTTGNLIVGGASGTINGNAIWHAGNDGSGSGLDADTLDGQHASAFLTSYTETDTLATVTGRGSSTTTSCTFNTITMNTPVVGSSNKIKFANNDYIRYDDANGVGRFHFDADGGTNNASVQAATFVGALSTTGISGNNYNITNVNQLEINDPGEGIIWKSGSSGDITLAVVDDSSDNILRLSGTGAELQVGTNRVLTVADEGSGNGLDADLLDGNHASAFALSSHNHDSDYVNVTGDTMTGDLDMGGNWVSDAVIGFKNMGPTQGASPDYNYIYYRITDDLTFDKNRIYELLIDADDNGGYSAIYHIYISQHNNSGNHDRVRFHYISGDKDRAELLVATDEHVWVRATAKWGNVKIRAIHENEDVSSMPFATTETRPTTQANGTSDFQWNGDNNTFTDQEQWHAGNDGAGSGLDADLLDGQEGSYYATASHNHDSDYVNVTGDTMTGALTISNNNPALILNDGDSTNTTNQVGYISLRNQGSETGWFGFGSNGNSDLTVKNNSGKVVLNGSSGVNIPNGNVGIGTTDPSDGDLNINNPRLHVLNTGSAGTYNLVARFQAGPDSDNTGAAIAINHSNDRGLLIKAGRKDSDRPAAYFDLIDSSGSTTNLLTMGEYGSNFNVGIGTTSPSAKLHVHSTSGDGLIRVTGDNIINSGGAIKGFDNGLAFNVAPSGGGSEIEAIRIKGDGNVGIGTPSPSYKLSIESSAADQLKISRTGVGFWNFNTYASGDLVIDNGSEHMRITSNGRVGIGETNPQNPLSVYHATFNKIATFISGDNNGLIQISDDDTNSYVGSEGSLTYIGQTAAASSNNLIINSSGKVGIGETNPARALTVKHSTQQGVARFVSGSTTMAFIDLKDANTTADNKVRFGAVGDELSLWANGERMRIDSSGNVGIGETNPTYKLHVEGNSYINATSASANLTLGRHSGQPTIKAGSDDGGYLIMDSSGGRVGLNWYSGDHVVLAQGGGNVGINETNPSYKLDVNGGTDNTLARFSSTDDVAQIQISDNDTETWVGAKDGLSYISKTAGTPVDGIVIDNSNNVGIGTTNPVLFASGWGKVLGVSAASNYATVQISGGSGSGGEIDLGDASIRHAAIASLTGSHLGFYTNSTNTGDGVTERIRIASNGNVGINETNPAFKLDVNGSVAITEYLYHKGDSNTYLRFSGDMVQLVAGGVEMIRIVEDTQDEVVINENSADVDFRVESDTDTHALFLEGSSGNVGIGTSSPGSELEVDGEITTTTITYPEPGVVDSSAYNGEIVYFGSQISMSEGKLMVLSTSAAGATWYQARDNSTSLATGMLGIALGTTASAGVLVRGIAKNSAWSSFSEGEKLYLSPTSGAISNSITGDTNDFVRIIGYALGGNKIYFCPDNTYIQNS